jgi:elongation factor P
VSIADYKLQTGRYTLPNLQFAVIPVTANHFFQSMLAKDIKTGHIVNYNGAPCIIETINVQSPSARGAATFYKYRARNLITKQKVDITLRGGESLDEADFRRRPIKYMYADAAQLHFLDQENYEQYSLAREDVAEETKYLTEELEGIQALIYNDECVGIQLPVAVVLKVVQCDPGIKGASATARTKPATLETGLVVQVPEYLGQGESVKVDTRTGQYLSRA